MSLSDAIAGRIRREGPITVAAFMEMALYDPEAGYYASVPVRSGRGGDFYTSVDVGPVFGELVAAQLEEMWRISGGAFDLVEAGAGNGRLSADVLDAARVRWPDFYDAIRLHLVERSDAARAAQAVTLGMHASKIVSSGPALPAAVTGAIVANELLDALPVHAVVMRESGLRELFVGVGGNRFTLGEAMPSDPRLASYLDWVGARLAPGWHTEVGLAATDWVRQAARTLRRGFLLLVDYGHESAELRSATHAAGTIRTFRRHVGSEGSASHDLGGALENPGDRDITVHVDLTGIRLAAEEEGLDTLAALDQTYFLLGLGAAELAGSGGSPREIRRRLALKTLLWPGGLGSTHKVLVFGRDVGRPALRGCSYRVRLT
jgi:SAM-dependent MidA family methyltransferase